MAGVNANGPANGPWGHGPVSGLPWWSGASWRTAAMLKALVDGPRGGRGVDIIQLFSPLQHDLAGSWDMLAGGKGDDPGTHDGALSFTRGGRQGWLIWGDPTLRTMPIAYALRLVPEGIESNAQGAFPRVWENLAVGRHDDVWRRFGRRCAWNDRIFGRTATFILELGWEMSGDWYPWSIAGRIGGTGSWAYELFPAAWEQIVQAIRAGYQAQSGEHCPYLFAFRPGRCTLDGVRLDKFLPPPGTWDVLGLTAHDNTPCTWPNNPRASWLPATDPHGKVVMEGWTACAEIARRYRRGVAFFEWGGYPDDSQTYRSGDGGLFVRSFWDFLQAHRELIAAECFFDRTTTSFSSRPGWSASQAYRELWGQPLV